MMKSCMVCTFPLAELSNPDYKPNWSLEMEQFVNGKQ